MNAQDYSARQTIVVLKSQIDRLEGKLEGILEGVKSNATKIQKLEDEAATPAWMRHFVGKES